MAVEKFIVLYDKKSAGTQVSQGLSETSKTAAEALSGKFKEKVVLLGGTSTVTFVELEAEEEKQAAVAARYILGAKEGEGEVLVAKAANVKKNKAF